MRWWLLGLLFAVMVGGRAPGAEPAAAPEPAAPERQVIMSGDTISYSFVENAPEATLQIRPGDQLRIILAEDASLQFEGRVPENGAVVLPYVGEVLVAGKTVAACASDLKALLTKDLYKRATVSVGVLERALAQEVGAEVTVPPAGRINVPRLGSFPVSGRDEATAGAELKKALDARYYQDARVSVRMLRRSPGTVHVYGAVKAPGVVHLPELDTLTVLQGLAEVGGITNYADPKAAYVKRVDRVTGVVTKLPVDLERAINDVDGTHNIRLQANDQLVVPYVNTQDAPEVLKSQPAEVIVVGQVSNPGVITFAPGELRTVMRAIFKAGNFTKFAQKSKVRLIRMGKDHKRTIQTIDVSEVMDEGFLDRDVELLPGDMLIVGEKWFSL